MGLKLMTNTLNSIGYHGPYILFMMSFFFIITSSIAKLLLRSNINTYLLIKTVIEIGNKTLILLIWNVINIWCNEKLKNKIKQPRPKNSIKINDQDVINSASYGMPSGHAQIAMTNLVFLSLATRNILVMLIASLQTLLTLYQRYIFKMHTINQLIAGSILGGISGYLLYIILQNVDSKYKKHDKKVKCDS